MSFSSRFTPALRQRRRGMAIAAIYASQALGYASVMTGLPSIQTKWQIDEFAISLIMLGACFAAALGSLIANAIAVRVGTKVGVIVALVLQAVTVAGSIIAPSFPTYVVILMLYGIGLGIMDASQNAQAVGYEATVGRSSMGRFYAIYTAAAMIGALLMSIFLASSGAVASALAVAALVDCVVLILVLLWMPGRNRLHSDEVGVAVGTVASIDKLANVDAATVASTANDAHADADAHLSVAHASGTTAGAAASATVPTSNKMKLPVAKIFGIGSLIFAAYMLDSAVSSWSSIYLAKGLQVAAAAAPLGYAAYQGAVLVARLFTDRADQKFGRVKLGVSALLIGLLGCLSIALLPTVTGAVIGFCLAGVATGITVPIAISAAGAILPERRDEVITRVNLFNYGGAVIGAVTLGLVATGPTLGMAFLIPGVALLAFLPMTRLLRTSRRGTLAAAQGSSVHGSDRSDQHGSELLQE